MQAIGVRPGCNKSGCLFEHVLSRHSYSSPPSTHPQQMASSKRVLLFNDSGLDLTRTVFVDTSLAGTDASEMSNVLVVPRYDSSARSRIPAAEAVFVPMLCSEPAAATQFAHKPDLHDKEMTQAAYTEVATVASATARPVLRLVAALLIHHVVPAVAQRTSAVDALPAVRKRLAEVRAVPHCTRECCQRSAALAAADPSGATDRCFAPRPGKYHVCRRCDRATMTNCCRPSFSVRATHSPASQGRLSQCRVHTCGHFPQQQLCRHPAARRRFTV